MTLRCLDDFGGSQEKEGRSRRPQKHLAAVGLEHLQRQRRQYPFVPMVLPPQPPCARHESTAVTPEESHWCPAVHLHRRFHLFQLSQQSTVGGSVVLKLKHWWRDVAKKSLGMMAQKILGYLVSFHCSENTSSVVFPSSLPLSQADEPVFFVSLPPPPLLFGAV